MNLNAKSILAKSLWLIGVYCLCLGSASAETVLGRWCDKSLPSLPQHNSVMTIVITDEGKVMLRERFADGSALEEELREAAGGIYEMAGTDDKFRIVPSTGNLQLIDNDGLIRTAIRLENTPRSGECST